MKYDWKDFRGWRCETCGRSTFVINGRAFIGCTGRWIRVSP